MEITLSPELLSAREFHASVVTIHNLSHNIKAVRFALPEGVALSFRAGQYVQLSVPPHEDIEEPVYRAYSIASRPSEKSAFELMIRHVPGGVVSSYIFTRMKKGDILRFTGPFGQFGLRDTDRECLFIAGGVGLAPIRSILHNMVENGIRKKSSLFFGVENLNDIYHIKELRGLERENAWFRFIPAVTRQKSGHYEHGQITEVVTRHCRNLDDHEAYLCGSPAMVDACIRILTDKGMPEEHIYYDKFG